MSSSIQQIAKARRMSVTEVRAVFDELNIDPRSITSRTNWEINHYVDILRFIVTICTSFLMTDGADRYFQQFIKAFKTKKAYIPLGTIKELNSNLKNAVPEKRQRARRAASIVRDLLAVDAAEIRGEPCDGIPEQVQPRVYQQYRHNADYLALTNDLNVMKLLRQMERNEAVKSRFRLRVVKIHGKTGEAVPFKEYGEQEPQETFPKKRNTKVANIPPQRKGSCNTEVNVPLEPISLDRRKLEITVDLSEGSNLRDGMMKPCSLGKKIGRGGQATVYYIHRGDGLVGAAKIFSQSQLTESLMEKVKQMLKMRLAEPHVCWPKDELYDDSGRFRGYIMDLAYNKPLSHTIFLGPTATNAEYADWNRTNSVTLAWQIAKVVERLHSRGIVIGDLSGDNIVINKDTPTFIDTDSFQFGRYPCPVYRPEYTSANRIGTDFRKVFRTKEDDYFALAVLLWMVLVPGKHPFAFEGGNSPAENIKRGYFPYPTGRDIPVGKWKYAWSHLGPMQNYFEKAFSRDEKVPDAASARKLLREYQDLLADPANTFCGPKPGTGFDLAILPQCYYRPPGIRISRFATSDYEREINPPKTNLERIKRWLFSPPTVCPAT